MFSNEFIGHEVEANLNNGQYLLRLGEARQAHVGCYSSDRWNDSSVQSKYTPFRLVHGYQSHPHSW